MQPKNPFPNKPAPYTERKSALTRFRERFQEKPATKEEVAQLGLDAKREVYKTMKQKAKAGRPSRFSFGGGFQPAPASYRRGSRRAPPETGSWLLGSNNSPSFLDSGSGPSLDFITGGGQQKSSRGKPQRSGLEDMFT